MTDLVKRILLGIFVSVAFAIPISSADGAGFKVARSALSDANEIVEIITIGTHFLGCSAGDAKLQSPLILTLTPKGSGAIAFQASKFGLAPSGRIMAVPVTIAGKDSTAHAVVDGQMLSLPLINSEMTQGLKDGLSINNTALDLSQLAKLKGLLDKCLETQK